MNPNPPSPLSHCYATSKTPTPTADNRYKDSPVFPPPHLLIPFSPIDAPAVGSLFPQPRPGRAEVRQRELTPTRTLAPRQP